MLRFLILLLLPLALWAQDDSLTLAGTVVNSATGEPLARALVTVRGYQVLANAGRGQNVRSVQRTGLTDASGTFRFSALPAATYSVSAQKPGFAASLLAGQSIVRTELKSSREDIRIALAPLGVITGTVVDQDGQPMRGVVVNALTLQTQDGVRRPLPARTSLTDDRGVYRLWNLTPGKYYLRVAGQGGATTLPSAMGTLRNDIGDSFPFAYADGARTIGSARPVEVGGAVDTVADFHLRLEPAFRIDGTFHNLTASEKFSMAIEVNGEEMPVTPDRLNRQTGEFEIKDVVSGSYTLRAVQGEKTGEVAVNVQGADASGVNLTLYPAVDIPVITKFTNAAPPPPKVPVSVPDADFDFERMSGAQCGVVLVPDQSSLSEIPLRGNDDGQGSAVRATTGRQRVSFACYGAYIHSAYAGAQDLLANPILTIIPGTQPPPIEILATHGGGTIQGKLDESAAAGGAQVLLVPQSAAPSGVVVQTVPANFGKFVFSNVAPGTYNLYAFASADIEYRNPEFLKTLSGGESVQIDSDDAQKEVVIQKVIP